MLKRFSSLSRDSATPLTLSEDKAAERLQRFFRQHRYRLHSLPLAQSKNHGVIVWSGDAKADVSECKLQPEERVALIGNSGLRSVEFACELVHQHQVAPPQLFILDRDWNVIQFWRQLIAIMASSEQQDEKFEREMNALLSDEHHLFVETRDKPALLALIFKQTKILLTRFSFALVKDIIQKAVVVRQDWAHTLTFQQLRDQLRRDQYQQVVVYASNIISLSPQTTALTIAKNIALLRPDWSIHENYAPYLGYPTEAWITANSEPAAVVASAAQRMTFRYHGFASPVYATNQLFNQMLGAFRESLLGYHVDISTNQPTLMVDVILRIAGIHQRLPGCHLERSRYRSTCVLHLPFEAQLTDAFVKQLRQAFHGVDIAPAWLNEGTPHATLPMQITINLKQLINEVIPAVVLHLVKHPDLIDHYQQDLDWMFASKGLGNILDTFRPRAAAYQLDLCATDCLEDTLCHLVKQDCKQRGLPMTELVSTQSSFMEDFADMNVTRFLLTLSGKAAQQIVNYLNYLEPNSALLADAGEQGRVLVKVRNSVLLSEAFLAAFDRALEERLGLKPEPHCNKMQKMV